MSTESVINLLFGAIMILLGILEIILVERIVARPQRMIATSTPYGLNC